MQPPEPNAGKLAISGMRGIHAFFAEPGLIYNLLTDTSVQVQKNFMSSAGKRVTGAKPGKSCNRCQAQENL